MITYENQPETVSQYLGSESNTRKFFFFFFFKKGEIESELHKTMIIGGQKEEKPNTEQIKIRRWKGEHTFRTLGVSSGSCRIGGSSARRARRRRIGTHHSKIRT